MKLWSKIYVLILGFVFVGTTALYSQGCGTDAGTFVVTTYGNTNNFNMPAGQHALCLNDYFEIISNGDYILPPPSPANAIPSMIYLFYKQGGMTHPDPHLDPNWNASTTMIFGEDFVAGTSLGANLNNAGANSTVATFTANGGNSQWCFVPVTGDHGVSGTGNEFDENGDGCWDLGQQVCVTYLNPITFSYVERCDGTVEVTISGGYPQKFTGNYNLTNTGAGTLSSNTVSSSGGTVTISGLSNGQVYGFTVSDDNGCPATFSGSGNYAGPPNANINAIGPFCSSDAPVALSAFTPGGSWSVNNSPNAGVFDPSTALCGMNEIAYQVSNANCTSYDTIQVEVLCPAFDSVITGNVTCNGFNNGSIEIYASFADLVSINGGASWLPVGSVFAGLNPGNYSVKAKDNLGCGVVSTTVTVSQPGVLSVNVTGTNVNCYNVNDGTASASVSGGTSPYTYLWSGTPQTTANISGLYAGNYSLTVTDSKGCLAYGSIVLTQPPSSISISSSVVNVKCFGNNTGQATVSPSGGTSPYSYLWDINAGGQTTQTATGLIAGSYAVTVSDLNGCADSSVSVTINQPASPLKASGITDSVNCFGDIGSLSVLAIGGTGPNYTYQWDANTGNQTGATANGLSGGIYQVTVTDAEGCQADTSLKLFQPNVITINEFVVPVFCRGNSTGKITVSVSGGTVPYSYNWNPGGFGTTISNLPAGAYSIVVQDAKGCSKSENYTITQPSQPLSVSINTSDELCVGNSSGAISVTASGGTSTYSYLWDGGQTTASVVGLNTGYHCVTVTDFVGCKLDTCILVNLRTNAVLQLDLDSVTCYGLSDGKARVDLSNAIGTLDFVWNTNAGIQTTQTAVGLNADTVSVTVTESIGCVFDTFAVILQPDSIELSISTVSTICPDSSGQASVSVLGGVAPYTYLWDTLSGFQTTQTATGLWDTIFWVRVTDHFGCMDSAFASVGEIVIIEFNETISNLTCYQSNDGAIQLNPSNGQLPYIYAWQNNISIDNQALNLDTGSYYVKVFDAYSCAKDTTFFIDQPDSLYGIMGKKDVKCFGDNNGYAFTKPMGGTPPYSFQWNNIIQNDNDSIMGGAGNYVVEIQDSNACVFVDSISIGQPAVLGLSLAVAQVSCFDFCDGNIIAIPSGGTSPYGYLWNTLQTTQNIIDLCPGFYQVSVTDFNGCGVVADTVIVQPTAIQAHLSMTLSTCGNPTGSASVDSITGGVPGYTWVWDASAGGGTDSVAVYLTDGYFPISITDNSGCQHIDSIYVDKVLGPELDFFGVQPTSCFDSCDGEANALVLAGTGTAPFQFIWQDGTLGATLLNACAGIYNVTVTDDSLCADVASIEIIEPSEIQTITLASPSNLCLGDSMELNTLAGGGNGGFSYMWNGAIALQSFWTTPVLGDKYWVIATDNNGCNSLADTVSFTFYPQVNVSTDNFVTICRGNEALLQANAFGGTGTGYEFIWSTGDTTALLSTNPDNYPDTTQYFVYSNGGCLENDTAWVQVAYHINPVVEMKSDYTYGCLPLEVHFTNETENTIACEWDFGNDLSETSDCNPTTIYDQANCYDIRLSVFTPDGCRADSVYTCQVEVVDNPVADFSFEPSQPSMFNNKVFFEDQSAGSPIVKWFWDFGGNGIDSTENPVFEFPGYPETYSVGLKVLSVEGCYDSIFYDVVIAPEFVMYLPNAFTPNGDGLNDEFKPQAIGVDLEDYRMTIFSRGGDVVFESFALDKGWDGSVENMFGGEAYSNVYVYTISYKSALNGEEKTVRGKVTLLRGQ